MIQLKSTLQYMKTYCLRVKPTKWSNTLKQLSAVTDELCMPDHFVGLTCKGLKKIESVILSHFSAVLK